VVGIAFVLSSIVLPGVLAGALALGCGWGLARRAGRPRLAAGLCWLALVGCALLGFLLSADLRGSLAWPRLDRPGFVVALLPLALIPLVLLLRSTRAWMQTVAWGVAGGALATCMALGYRWQAKNELGAEGDAGWWFVLAFLAIIGFAWTWSRAAGSRHWRALAVYALTGCVLAAFTVFHVDSFSGLTIGILVAVVVGGGVGAQLGGLSLYALAPALPAVLALSALAGMARVGAVVEDVTWLPSILVVVAFLPWAVITCLPLRERARGVGEVIAALFAGALLLTGTGLAAQSYLDEDGAGTSEEEAADPYGSF